VVLYSLYGINFLLKRRLLMINLENHLGTISISDNYFANLVGNAASSCFGVVSMSDLSLTGGIISRVRKDEPINRGVRIRTVDGRLVIDMHIIVSYGVNISAIVKSIIHKVRYTVEEATGLDVAKVNVYVDRIAE